MGLCREGPYQIAASRSTTSCTIGTTHTHKIRRTVSSPATAAPPHTPRPCPPPSTPNAAPLSPPGKSCGMILNIPVRIPTHNKQKPAHHMRSTSFFFSQPMHTTHLDGTQPDLPSDAAALPAARASEPRPVHKPGRLGRRGLGPVLRVGGGRQRAHDAAVRGRRRAYPCVKGRRLEGGHHDDEKGKRQEEGSP